MVAFADGTPCWADATLPDVAAGKRFYGELFGWTFREGTRAGEFTVLALRDGKEVAALAPQGDGRMPTVWNVYVATPDAAAGCDAVREAGGRVLVGPLAVGRLGTVALAADPAGAVFGLWESGTHTGFALKGAPGSYAWTEVHTRDGDKERCLRFYEDVFGYGAQQADFTDGTDFTVWSLAGRSPGPEHAVGGLEVMAAGVPAETPPYFLVYFAVEDCDASARTAVRLGGRVVEEPADTPYGRHAVLADDQGARFAVIALTRD
ncbi:VOC family protein [Streptomyces meridianus]|uniref:VOC family protein n=1 Tax=Streptomyces meridianus TaxID=2938945 RepID=A0ABT0X2K7_9ACTN|nr:VOC family protein [Streptomyces meridianus]MCM2576776.1 VOC family protein [Streptomyces meridianus]